MNSSIELKLLNVKTGFRDYGSLFSNVAFHCAYTEMTGAEIIA